jgi:hypothetical protein
MRAAPPNTCCCLQATRGSVRRCGCRDAGPRAEGEGYWLVAEAAGWYGAEGVRDRAFTEASRPPPLPLPNTHLHIEPRTLIHARIPLLLPSPPPPHLAPQDRARDSFENLLFSLCRFYELTGRYPDSLTLVGYEFKRRRFSQLHRAALRLPQEAFRYEGTPALNSAALQVCVCVGGGGGGCVRRWVHAGGGGGTERHNHSLV